jgi:hypothetical protein
MNNQFLTKVAEFIQLSIDNSHMLQEKLYQQQKVAVVKDLNQEKYRVALQKTADTLYYTDYFSTEQEKQTFLRKAAEDPVYVVRTLEKICEANDVAQLGKPAKVASRINIDEHDPVMEAAFGFKSRGIIDEE